MTKEVDVFVPAFNEAAHISTTITSIQAQEPTDEYHFNVLVVANGCTDGTGEIAGNTIAELPPHPSISLDVAERPEASKTKALNFALGERATSDLVIYCDGDVTFSDRCFEQVAADFEDPQVQLSGAVARYKIPDHLQGTYLGQVHRVRQLYDDAAGPWMRPIGRLMAFRATAIESLYEDTAAEDAWVLATIAQRYGWDSVSVAQEASVYATAQGDWLDFIRQESRFVRGNEHLLDQFPDLSQVIEEGRQRRRALLRSRAEIEAIIGPTMAAEGLPMSLIDDLQVITRIYFDNARISPGLVSPTGGWEPITSTKKPAE